MRRRGASSAGKNDPVRIFGIRTVTSPVAVVTSLSRWPLRWVVRASLRWWRSAPMWAVASASTRACSIVCRAVRIRLAPSPAFSASVSSSRADWSRAIAWCPSREFLGGFSQSLTRWPSRVGQRHELRWARPTPRPGTHSTSAMDRCVLRLMGCPFGWAGNGQRAASWSARQPGQVPWCVVWCSGHRCDGLGALGAGSRSQRRSQATDRSGRVGRAATRIIKSAPRRSRWCSAVASCDVVQPRQATSGKRPTSSALVADHAADGDVVVGFMTPPLEAGGSSGESDDGADEGARSGYRSVLLTLRDGSGATAVTAPPGTAVAGAPPSRGGRGARTTGVPDCWGVSG